MLIASHLTDCASALHLIRRHRDPPPPAAAAAPAALPRVLDAARSRRDRPATATLAPVLAQPLQCLEFLRRRSRRWQRPAAARPGRGPFAGRGLGARRRRHPAVLHAAGFRLWFQSFKRVFLLST